MKPGDAMREASRKYREYLVDVFETGTYTFVLRWSDGEEVVTDASMLEEAFAPGREHPGLALHEPDRVFLNLAVLGDRVDRDGDEGILRLPDGQGVRLVEIERVPLVEHAVYVRLVDEREQADEPIARTVVRHLERGAKGHAGVAYSHGYLPATHVGWFSHVGWFAQVLNAGTNPSTTPEPSGVDWTDGRPSQQSTAPIGLIDTGVDDDHAWLHGRVDGHGPAGLTEQDAHGTLVAGVLRQAAPGSKIHSVRASTKAHHPPNDMELIKALAELTKHNGKPDHPDIEVVVMSFGGENLSDWQPLGDAIATFVDAGGTVFAAAGNLYDDHDHTHTHATGSDGRRVVYPAGFDNVRGVAGGPVTRIDLPVRDAPLLDEPAYYPWSNGGLWVSDVIKVDNAERDTGYLYSSYLTNPAVSATPPSGPVKKMFATAQGTSLLAPIAAAIFVRNEHESVVNPFPDWV